MSRALVSTLILGIAKAADPYEWKGVFYTPEDTYMWGAQKTGPQGYGPGGDLSMTMAMIPVAGATAEALAGASGKGAEALGLTCEDVQSGGTMTPAEGKCYKLVFDQGNKQSLYTINAKTAGAIAFFTQHLPTEFEDTDHYLKDTSGVDIEPVAQEPDGGHDHAHGHGTGPDAFLSKCVCQAKAKGWKLDCSNKAAIEEAVSKLEAKAAVCKATDPPEDCKVNYHMMQAHHDHCLHDDLPTGIEKKLHDYEHFYDDCFIKRQFNPALGACPQVDCGDATAMTKAIATLQAGCATKSACADSTCSAAIKTVLMAHDVCPEDKLPNNLEVALHDHEEPCETQLCNTAGGAFNPNDDPCGETAATANSPDTSAASGFGSQETFFVATLALPLALAF